jgi:hypothetical protein
MCTVQIVSYRAGPASSGSVAPVGSSSVRAAAVVAHRMQRRAR